LSDAHVCGFSVLIYYECVVIHFLIIIFSYFLMNRY
jgi:hypothetical protein